jgi:hypothetical protein
VIKRKQLLKLLNNNNILPQHYTSPAVGEPIDNIVMSGIEFNNAVAAGM